MPEITILMPVRNGEKYIKESIDSILKQTFTDFELLIMDDGSTDRTVERIERYTDERIRLIRRKHNFIRNLNEGLELALGAYIARMDADDISMPERFVKQIAFMNSHPDIDCLGTWAIEIDDDGKEYFRKKMPITHEE